MEPKNGEHGWELERYVWDPETGVGRFFYTRGEDEQTMTARSQLRYHTKAVR